MADEFEEDIVFDRDNLIATYTNSSPSSKKKSGCCGHAMVVTVLLCAAFFGLGLCLAIPGPTLKELSSNTGVNISQITFIFMARSAGYLSGSIIGGMMFDCFNQPCLLSVSMTLCAVATGIAPWCRKFVYLASLIVFQGVTMGFLDTGGNLMCLEAWGKESGPAMQALHFSFGFGAFIAPLLAAPFLDMAVDVVNTSTALSTTTIRALTSPNATQPTKNDTDSLEKIPDANPITNIIDKISDLSPVKFAYLAIALYVGVIGFFFFVLLICSRKPKFSASKQPDTLRSSYTARKEKMTFRITMLLLLATFYFFYVGMEVTYGGLIATFTLNLNWDQKKGALMTSTFWGSFAAGRLLSIFLARCVTPAQMLIGDLSISTLSLLALVFFLHKYEFVFWIATATLGLGMASIFPSGISWVERYIQMTGKATSVFVVGSALGEMVLPVMTGYLLHKDYMWLMYLELGCAIFSAFLYIIMQNLACSVGERYEHLQNLAEDQQPLRDDADDDGDRNRMDSGIDKKRHVTFNLASSALRAIGKDGSSKNSILKSKNTAHKD